MANPKILLWHRQDLRLLDHEPLHQAVSLGATVFPVYCLDDRLFQELPLGFPKTGVHRTQFLLASLTDLRQQYRSHGADLIYRRGQPEAIIPSLVHEWGITHLYFHTYPTAEELTIERALLEAIAIPHRRWWSHTLYNPQDLPFPLDQLPELFTKFRKIVEGAERRYPTPTKVRPPLPPPDRLPPIQVEAGDLTSLAELGIHQPPIDPRAPLSFRGGTTAAQERLHHYFWQTDRLRSYKETRNGMIGADYSSKFSPWLALGCLSPRWIYSEVQRYEQERTQNDSTYWLVFELLWRDYFAFIAAKHGDRLFRRGGLRQMNLPWKQDPQRFQQWYQGQTGFPLVDANMRELEATGFMSNRGRQNVASFLTKNLGIDWRWGAAWFESLLLDYDPASNWGNWNYTAGVGNDARGFRFFNIYKQGQTYDPQGEYIKLWLPELAAVPGERFHTSKPWLPVEQQRWGVSLGVDYPQPIVDLFKSAQANEKIYNAASL